MKRLVLFLLLSGMAWAQPTFNAIYVTSNPSGDLDDRGVTFGATVTASNNQNFYFRANCGTSNGRPSSDTSADYVSAGWWRRRYVGDTTTARRVVSSILAPSTTYYCSLEMSDATQSTWAADDGVTSEMVCPVTCTQCTSGDDSLFGDSGDGDSNFDCTTGENPRFTTASEDAGIPVAPTAPSHTLSAVTPAADGHHDPAADCSDLTTAQGSAETAAEGGGTNEAIDMPSAVSCDPALTIVNLTDGRIQYVGEDVGTNVFPPAGTRIDKTFRPYMGRFSPDPDDPQTWPTFQIDAGTNGNNHDFVGVSFEPPEHTAVDKISVAITDITGNVLTLASMPFANGNVVFAYLAGTGITNGHGPARACAISGNTMELCGNSSLTTEITLLGSWSAGGTVELWPSQTITGHTEHVASGDHQVTVTDHGLVEYNQITITGNSGPATLSFGVDPDDYQIDTTRAVYIQGSADTSCNGTATVASVGSGTLGLTFNGTATDCDDATDGTVQVIDSLVFWNTSSETIGGKLKKKVAHFLVIDANTIRMLDVPYEAGVTGGYITWETEIFPVLFVTTDDGNEKTISSRFDRVIIDFSFPWRSNGLLNWGGVLSMVLRDSWVELDHWARVDPVSGDVQRPISNSTQKLVAQASTSEDLQFINNEFRGITDFFADVTGPDPVEQVQDTSYVQNTSWTPTVWGQLGPNYEGIFRIGSGVNHEWKQALRFLFKGNYFAGTRFGGFTQQDTILDVTGARNQNGDVEISYNTVDRGGNFLLIDTQITSTTGGRIRYPNMRYWVHNNLIAQLSLDSQGQTVGNRIGTCLLFWGNIIDLLFERNTCHNANINDGAFRPDTDGGQGVVVRKNILPGNEGGSGRIGWWYSGGSGTDVRYPNIDTASASASLQTLLVRGVVADATSTQDDNVWIPCVESSNTLSYTQWLTAIQSDLDADTITADEFAAKAQVSTFSHFDIVGASGTGDGIDSCLDRMNLAFEAGTFTLTSTYTGYGADIDTMQNEQGRVRDVQITRSSTTATVTVTAPDTVGSTVDLVPVSAGFFDAAGEITRSTNGGGSTTQVFTFTGLNSGTAYYLRIMNRRIYPAIFTTL